MPKVTLKEIGPAERKVAELLISDITHGDRSNMFMARGIRRQLKLRQLRHEMDAMIEEHQNRLIATLGPAPALRDNSTETERTIAQVYQRQVSTIKQNVAGVPWGIMLDEGYDEKDVYGLSYDVDKTTLQWLFDRRTKREVWVWETDAGVRKADKDGEPIPQKLDPAMVEAIGNLDYAIQGALGTESPEPEPD